MSGNNRKRMYGVLFVLLLLGNVFIIDLSTANIQTLASSVKTIWFKFLAVEGLNNPETGTGRTDGQYWIRNLQLFPNWSNNTMFKSQMILLSNNDFSRIFTDVQKFYKGPATRGNLKYWVKNFFKPSHDIEISFLLIACHNAGKTLLLDPWNNTVGSSELKAWLAETPATVILDCCDAGWYLNELGDRNVLGACSKYQCSHSDWHECAPGPWGIFTGQPSVPYPNRSMCALGMLGSLTKGIDSNKDKWLSVSEGFRFAKRTVEENIAQHNFTQEWLMQNPVASIIQDMPLVLREFEKTDLNFDGIVNMDDIAVAARAFGSYKHSNESIHSRWNGICDMNGDKEINLVDVGLIATDFGKFNFPFDPPLAHAKSPRLFNGFSHE